jgi:hypothetical protein
MLIFKLWLNRKDQKEVSFDFADLWVLSSSSNLSVEGCSPELVNGERSYSVVHKNKYFLTGKDIYEVFDLNEDKMPQTYIPGASGRINQWTAVLKDSNNLLVQHLHSYPDGGQTCFYREKIYHFVKHDG